MNNNIFYTSDSELDSDISNDLISHSPTAPVSNFSLFSNNNFLNTNSMDTTYNYFTIDNSQERYNRYNFYRNSNITSLQDYSTDSSLSSTQSSPFPSSQFPNFIQLPHNSQAVSSRFSRSSYSPAFDKDTPHFSLATLNVRGLNNDVKQDSIYDDLFNNNFSIIGFSETKLDPKVAQFKFKKYWAAQQHDHLPYQQFWISTPLKNKLELVF